MTQNPVVTFEMENGKTFRAELYPEIAPNTVNNFVSLIKKGFYDGVIFHRGIYDSGRRSARNGNGRSGVLHHGRIPYERFCKFSPS